MLQVVTSPSILILTARELSFMLLENIYGTGVTYITYGLQNIFIVHATVNHNCEGCHKLEHHSRVINYAPRVINYAPRVVNYAPREHI